MNRSKHSGMSTKTIVVLLISWALWLTPFVEAQQTKKVHRIGFLAADSASSTKPRTDAFREGLQELGYLEGTNIVIEYRFAEGKLDRLPDLAAELVGLNFDILVTALSPPSLAAKKATETIPIVMVAVADPVASGLVASLARPGGSATGLTGLSPETSARRLQLLKETVPKVSRVGVIGTANPSSVLVVKETQTAAPELGIQLQIVEIGDPSDLESAFLSITKKGVGALILPGDPIFAGRAKTIADLAVKHRLPAMYSTATFVEAGGLDAPPTMLIGF
jgi:ABC-type uncharacterized transport system substrate-binding protein